MISSPFGIQAPKVRPDPEELNPMYNIHLQRTSLFLPVNMQAAGHVALL
jgi:hypothetical protein